RPEVRGFRSGSGIASSVGSAGSGSFGSGTFPLEQPIASVEAKSNASTLWAFMTGSHEMSYRVVKFRGPPARDLGDPGSNGGADVRRSRGGALSGRRRRVKREGR